MKNALEILRKLQIETEGKTSAINLFETLGTFIEDDLQEIIDELEEHQNKLQELFEEVS